MPQTILVFYNARTDPILVTMESDYTVVDMCFWSGARVIPFVLGADAWEKRAPRKAFAGRDQCTPSGTACGSMQNKIYFQGRSGGRCAQDAFPVERALKANRCLKINTG